MSPALYEDPQATTVTDVRMIGQFRKGFWIYRTDGIIECLGLLVDLFEHIMCKPAFFYILK